MYRFNCLCVVSIVALWPSVKIIGKTTTTTKNAWTILKEAKHPNLFESFFCTIHPRKISTQIQTRSSTCILRTFCSGLNVSQIDAQCVH
jgi:hypothetical protein